MGTYLPGPYKVRLSGAAGRDVAVIPCVSSVGVLLRAAKLFTCTCTCSSRPLIDC